MDNGTLVAATHPLDARRVGLRRASVVAALAIVLSLFVLVQQPAQAAPNTAPAGISAQTTDFRQFTCPILLQIRARYAASPFFASVVPIIDEVIAEFGCLGGTTTTTVAPTTTTTVVSTTTTTVVGPPPTLPPFLAGLGCQALLAIRPAIAASPFFAAFLPIIDLAIATFCGISG